NAMHVELPEPVDVVAVDVGWTKQRYILPNALRRLDAHGSVLSLLKPQYEAPPGLVRKGKLIAGEFEAVLEAVTAQLREFGVSIRKVVRLPQEERRKNPEAFLYILRADCRPTEDFYQAEAGGR
ncbi:MAG: hypothetical protein ACYS1C_08020, partial [Planctomycetota bacterium]